MKIGTLRAIAHNIADSLRSGIGILIGVYDMNVFGEAKRSPGRIICIDFLSARATKGKVSRSLGAAIVKYRKVLPSLCGKHGTSINDFKTLTASYSTERYNRRIVVTVQDRLGRCYVDEYIGTPASHVKVIDRLGRIRTKRGGIRRLTCATPKSGH